MKSEEYSLVKRALPSGYDQLHALLIYMASKLEPQYFLVRTYLP